MANLGGYPYTLIRHPHINNTGWTDVRHSVGIIPPYAKTVNLQ